MKKFAFAILMLILCVTISYADNYRRSRIVVVQQQYAQQIVVQPAQQIVQYAQQIVVQPAVTQQVVVRRLVVAAPVTQQVIYQPVQQVVAAPQPVQQVVAAPVTQQVVTQQVVTQQEVVTQPVILQEVQRVILKEVAHPCPPARILRFRFGFRY